MPPTTYTLAIDWNDDGDFSDSGENLTADVFRMEWRLGMRAAYDTMAAPISARITCRSPTRAYSPEYTANDLTPGKPIRIQSFDGTTARIHFTGYVEHVEPTPGTLGERLATIHARGHESEMHAQRILLGLQVNKRADQVIQAVLDSLRLRYPALNPYLIIGVDGHNIIGTDKLFGTPIAYTLEAGRSTFAYIADTWLDGLPADEAIRLMTESERGHFFIDRNGNAIFYHRHHTLLNTAVAATFTDSMDGLEYIYGADVINRVRARFRPRSIGTPGTVLWEGENPIRLDPGQTRQIVARFRDSDKRPIGALETIPPQTNVDYTANARADGTGADRTADVTLHFQPEASAALLEFRNTTTSTFFIQPGFTVRGTPIYQPDPLLIEHSDLTSITFYGLGEASFDFAALTDYDEADQLARYELVRRKQPRGLVRSVTLSSPLHQPQILARTLFDRITLHESQTDHTADYLIVAEHHTVDLGSYRHTVTWLLEPVDSDVFFIVGLHNPDGSRALSY